MDVPTVRRRSRLCSTSPSPTNMDIITPVASTMDTSNPIKYTASSSPCCASSSGVASKSSAHRSSRSPSRVSTSSSPQAIPKALRLLRLLLYSIAAPNFLYSMYVQIIVLKGPGRTPLPASIQFGRDSLFLTFHGNFHCAWYACLCLLHSFLSLGPFFNRRRRNNTQNQKVRRKSYAARTVEYLSHRFTPVLFPLIVFVGLAYYSILHFHPLNRLRATQVADHDSKMALLHFNPLLFILFDSWLKDSELVAKHAMKKRKATRAIIIYGMCYFLWCAFCVRMNGGNWPYPFQKSFSVSQHLMFVLASLLSSAYLCRKGFSLHARLDRRRRRRLALALERSSSSSLPSSTHANSCSKLYKESNSVNVNPPEHDAVQVSSK